MQIEIGTVIAERAYELRAEDGTETEIVVTIGAPMRDPRPGGDFFCPYQIAGLDDVRVRAAFGVDALQALLLALELVQVHLVSGAQAASATLTWLGEPGLGLQIRDILAAR